jgi:alpha-tubulin suppressor-like RCC1 family protein
MACGNGFDLVIANPYQVYSWGTNKSGQLGHGKPSHRHTKKPKLIPELFNIQAVAAGSDHSLALTYQGQVYSWGANSSGQLGLDHFDDLPTPTIIPHLDEIVAIFARHKGSLALNAQGQVYEWGILCTLPVVVSHPQLIELEKIINIAAGDNYCLFLTEKGEVWGAGYNDNGGMGFLNGFQHHPLRLIPSPDEVVALYVINGYSWFLNNQGEVYLVGDLGDATFFGEDGVTIQPLLLPGLTRIVSVVKAYFEILFLNNRGEVLSLDLSNLVLYLRGLRTPSFFHGNSLNLQCCSGNSTPLSITREGQLVYLHQHTASVIGEVEIY